MIRQQLQHLVSELNFAEIVDEAASADAAVAGAMAHDPDVVVLDIEMPGGGITALRRIKERKPQMRVMMLTNHAGPYYEKVCRRAGADYFLDKTIEFDQVPTVLAGIAGANNQ
ncbi:MAG: response regulator [Bacteroidetes bacterium]|nr:response regulator [Bacteroidota bacterium]